MASVRLRHGLLLFLLVSSLTNPSRSTNRWVSNSHLLLHLELHLRFEQVWNCWLASCEIAGSLSAPHCFLASPLLLSFNHAQIIQGFSLPDLGTNKALVSFFCLSGCH